MSPKVPCTRITGTGRRAVGRHDQSLAPGGLMPGTGAGPALVAAPAPAGSTSSRTTMATAAALARAPGTLLGRPMAEGPTRARAIRHAQARLLRRGARGGQRRRLVLAPVADRAHELDVRDGARDGRQPEREEAVGEHGHQRGAAVDVEGDQGPDQ